MATTTLDLVQAGMQNPEPIFKVVTAFEAAGILHSLFYTSGMPGAAAAPSGLNGAALINYAGQIPFTNPVSGNSHLALLEGAATVAGTLLICDRLWHNGSIGITTTTEQGITSPAWPARDLDGATAGRGIMVGLEVSGVTGGGAVTNTTMRYTSSANVNTRTATMASFPASAVAGTFVPFQLQAGDVGVKSIQGLTLGTTYVSGTIHMVAYRVLGRIGIGPERTTSKDIFQLAKPRMYNGTVPFCLWRPSTTGACNIDASVAWTQG